MTFTWDFFAFFIYTAMLMAFHCKADQYPPPTGLSYEWLDMFTVTLSWNNSMGLPDDSEIQFLVQSADNYSEPPSCLSGRSYTDSFFTEVKRSNRWTYNIWAVKNCNHSNESNPANITIITPKHPAQLVKDFKCFISPKKMNCSWIPANRSLNLTLSYRICGHTRDVINSLKKCNQFYSNGKRHGCYLHIDTTPDNICILVETETAMSTFKPLLVVPSPKLSIKRDGDYLNLSWTPPEFGRAECWRYELHYKECNVSKDFLAVQNMEMVPYDKRCLYEFRSRAILTESCGNVASEFSATVTYGANELPDRTMTVVAIVIPIILSLCVILSCYCFRRHSDIICPIIPDPSAIFKEMIMNGNKELTKPPANLYTPVPEPLESCKITLVPENSVLQHNS